MLLPFKKKYYLCIVFFGRLCPDGGIGRRAGLKHQWIHFHAGSIPALGTYFYLLWFVLFVIKALRRI